MNRIVLGYIQTAGPSTAPQIAGFLGYSAAEVAESLDTFAVANGFAVVDGAGVYSMTIEGIGYLKNSINAVEVQIDEQPIINAAFEEAPGGSTFLDDLRAAGFVSADAAALGAGYMELMVRAAVKTGNPLLLQRAVKRQKLAAALAAAL